MLSIIIADDEVAIIKLCRMLIQYPNASIVGEAYNGIELFEKIVELRPNTVITDISMPGMTGLELIEKVRTLYPEINFIVMSGYTDFEYVQTALRLGAWDYLLKPLQKAELNRILEKLDHHLESVQSELRQQANMQVDLQESLALLQQKYLRDVWQSGLPLPVPTLGNSGILDFSGKKLQCLVLCADHEFANQSEAGGTAQQGGRVFEKIAALGEEAKVETVSFSAEEEQITLFLYPAESADACWEKLRKKIGGEMRTFNNQSNFVRLTGAASQILPGGEESLPALMAQAKAALKWRLEKRGTPLLTYHVKTALELEQLPAPARLADLRGAVLRVQREEACSVIAQIWAETECLLPGSRYCLTEEMLACLNKALLLLPNVEAMETPPHIGLREVLRGSMSPQAISGQMQACVEKALSEYLEHVSQRESSVILKAKQYANQHLAKDISLNDVAKHVYLSPAYFSTLFKAETGSSFIKYLQHIRVEQAKKLLKDSNMRMQDIANAVGYRDMKYFKKVFANETSVAPSEYRKFYT